MSYGSVKYCLGYRFVTKGLISKSLSCNSREFSNVGFIDLPLDFRKFEVEFDILYANVS